MLVDHRTYLVRAGFLKEQVDLYEKYGFEVQKRHLGEPLAFLLDTGEVANSYIHIWIYKDADDRKKRRESLRADPVWQKYVKLNKDAGYLLKQDVRMMAAASFSPLKR